MTSPDDKLEAWIIRDSLKKDRRSRIVLPSSERLVSESPGDGEAALESIATWLSTQKKLPVVELATLSRRVISLTFAEAVELAAPWVSQARGGGGSHDQWGITLQHAMELPNGEGYGWQVAGLTGMGTLADGSRGLINTSRWGILGIAGTPEWTRHLMITQVMNQAAEPWSKGQDIWLVGYGETADKLISFLAPYHQPYRFHSADLLEQVSTSDLEGKNSTIYVMGADAQTEKQYTALGMPEVGLITDQIISDQCMFLSERTEGGAVLGPFSMNLEIYPNISPELIEAMERAWEANERLVREQAVAADYSELLSEINTERSGAEDTDEEINARFEALVTDLEEPVAEDSTDDREPSSSQESAHVAIEATSTEGEDVAPLEKVTKTEDEDMLGHELQVPGEQAVSKIPGLIESPDAITGSDAVNALDTSIAGIRLTLFGKVHAEAGATELKGRHAEALALLSLSTEPISPQQISEALWPEDETEGHTARTRRSRLLAKIRECVGEVVKTDAEGWALEPGHIATDYDEVLQVLSNEPIHQRATIIEACAKVSSPLDITNPWATEFRERMHGDLHRILSDLKDRAIDADAFDVAKAAKAADTKLGES